MGDWTVTCSECGETSEFLNKFARVEECAKCLADLHACVNCKFYDNSVSGRCRETSAEYVGTKEKANFCDFFKPSQTKRAEMTSSDEALSKLEALFKV